MSLLSVPIDLVSWVSEVFNKYIVHYWWISIPLLFAGIWYYYHKWKS